MYNLLTPLNIYKIVFVLELALALVISTASLNRNPHFPQRVILSLVFLAAAAFLFPTAYNSIALSFVFLSLFGLSLLMVKFCYDEPGINVFFCGVIAYTTQHIAYETYNFLVTISGAGHYGQMYLDEPAVSNLNPLSVFSYLASYLLTYWIIWNLLSYTIQSEERLNIGGYDSRLLLSFVIVLVDVVLNAVLVYSIHDSAELPRIIHVVIYLQNVLCCALSLGIQLTMLGKRAAEQEAVRIKQLWTRDREQYERFRESTELINIKCHDLKHQIRVLRNSENRVSQQALEKIENAIAIYDCDIKTGNQVLDTILAEKSLECQYEHIRFICIAEGRILDSLSAETLCSLFSNAITNAIEAVKKADDIEKRVIRLTVSKRNEMIFIHVENYCANGNRLVFVDGLPETTKEDRDYHGYGMRSMQMMAEKLGGGIEAHLNDDMFHLNIFIPSHTCET